MTGRTSSVLVIGAGVFGLASAVALTRAGFGVTVIDPEPESGGASAVAAGMISPGFELALAGKAPPARHAAVHRAAWDAWPAFAGTFGLALAQDGAWWVGPTEDLPDRFAAAGFRLHETADGLFAPEEGLIEPRPALARLRDAVKSGGGRIEAARGLSVRPDPERPGVETVGGRLEADRVLVACGHAAARLGGSLSRLFAHVTPIKGQIAVLKPRGERPDRVLRGPGVYAVPRPDGTAAVGATMQPGRGDAAIEPGMIGGLRLAAADLSPAYVGAELIRGEAGVRGATADGLPMVGTAAAGVDVALAPRRNGWLLAPLIADAAVASAKGRTPPFAALFDPLRFSRA